MEPHSKMLAGKVALVTGAAGKMGRVIAADLLRAGACVIWAGLRLKSLQALVGGQPRDGLSSARRLCVLEMGDHRVDLDPRPRGRRDEHPRQRDLPGPVEGEAMKEVISRRARAMRTSFEGIMRKCAWPTPLGRMVTSRDVSRLAIFLSSDDACNITGEVVEVSAGLGFWPGS